MSKNQGRGRERYWFQKNLLQTPTCVVENKCVWTSCKFLEEDEENELGVMTSKNKRLNLH